jgi:hypothetical protein
MLEACMKPEGFDMMFFVEIINEKSIICPYSHTVQ